MIPKIIKEIGQAIFAPELQQMRIQMQQQNMYERSIRQHKEEMKAMGLQYDDLMDRCRKAEEELKVKTAEVEMMHKELKRLHYAEYNEQSGFVPKCNKDGYACSTQCAAVWCYGAPQYCNKYSEDLPLIDNNRLPECIEEHGLNPGGAATVQEPAATVQEPAASADEWAGFMPVTWDDEHLRCSRECKGYVTKKESCHYGFCLRYGDRILKGCWHRLPQCIADHKDVSPVWLRKKNRETIERLRECKKTVQMYKDHIKIDERMIQDYTAEINTLEKDLEILSQLVNPKEER